MKHAWPLVGLGILLSVAASSSADESATVRFVSPTAPKSNAIELKNETVAVTIVAKPTPGAKAAPNAKNEKPGGVEITAKIYATLREPETSLMYESLVLATSDSKPTDFLLKLKLTGEKTPFKISKVDARGGLQEIEGEVIFDRYDAVTRGDSPKKRWSVVPGLGFAFYSYSETSVGTLNFFGISARVSGHYRFSPRWSAEGDTLIMVLPIIQSSSTQTSRFLNLSGRAVYDTPWLKGPWHLSLKGGLGYTTMLVDPADHGFTGMITALLYPSVTRPIGKGEGSAFLRYSPIFGLALGNQEIALGVGYTHPLSNQRNLRFNLEISNIGFTSNDLAGALRTTNTWGFVLTGGYAF